MVINMFPYITILNKQITSYIIMATIGGFVAGLFACKLAKNKNEDVNDVLILLLVSCVGLFIGGHILYAITNIKFIIKLVNNFNLIKSFKDLLDVLIYIFGGSVFYGGLIGSLIAGNIYVKKKKLKKDLYLDIGAIIIPLFHFFGRIGCFLSGCCYGVESKIGFKYNHSLVEQANGVNRFPIQLIESVYNLILFLILYKLYSKEKFKGKLIYIYLISYSIARFIFEFFRGDSYRGFLFGLSTSQIISIFLLIFSIIMLIIKNKKKSH